MNQSDIQQLSVADIRERIKEGKASFVKLKLNHAVSAIENPLQIRTARKTVARLQTELRKRELAEAKK